MCHLGGRYRWRRKKQPTPVLLPGKSHGQSGVGGYSPWGLKDRTVQLHFHFHSIRSKMQQNQEPLMWGGKLGGWRRLEGAGQAGGRGNWMLVNIPSLELVSLLCYMELFLTLIRLPKWYDYMKPH